MILEHDPGSANFRMTAPKTLTKKLCAIMSEAESVAKSGRNDQFNYDYVKEEDVVAFFRPLLAKHGVFLFHSVINEESFPQTTSKGTQGLLTKITVQYTFSCAETGESHSIFGKGFGWDTQDKGIYKALTGCHKYTLLKNFNLPTGDDPENETSLPTYGGGSERKTTSFPISSSTPPASALQNTLTGPEGFIIPAKFSKKFGGSPLSVMSDAQVQGDLAYWRGRVAKDGKAPSKELEDFMTAMEAVLTKRQGSPNDEILPF